jgi:hypothetical protein
MVANRPLFCTKTDLRIDEFLGPFANCFGGKSHATMSKKGVRLTKGSLMRYISCYNYSVTGNSPVGRGLQFLTCRC